jgi:hypothetical protein
LVSLTKEQKEGDDFLEEYYLAYGNASITRLVVLFDSGAILSAPNVAVYKGVYAIRSYYVEDIDSFWNFTTDRTTSTSMKLYCKDTFVLKRERGILGRLLH